MPVTSASHGKQLALSQSEIESYKRREYSGSEDLNSMQVASLGSHEETQLILYATGHSCSAI